ncbi:OTU-domain-containing protein [Testicularia cyperi]|uniref:Ubiquitin thioesterase OTU n=1 Tax=Testicularia cyperi TaxID=1882483 RepID=A0A317XI61_9BASI|nr:OTU-domain-containing protein [Testicularia cyperi]
MIRIRHPQGTSTFQVSESTTLGDLQRFVQAQSGIPAHQQDLKTGYPPKPLDLSSASESLPLASSSINIKKGEQVIVALRAGGGATGSSSTPTSQPVGSVATGSSRPLSTDASTANLSLQSQSTPLSTAVPAQRSSSSSSSSTTATLGGTSQPSRVPASTTAPPPRPVASRSSSSSSSSSSSRANAKTAQDINNSSFSVAVSDNQGYLTLQVVPDDNSCLFNSVGYLFEHRLGEDVCQALRGVVADVIRNDPFNYPDVVLGAPRETYIAKIVSPKTWGGAIELSILSLHLGIEIVALDVAAGTTHRFGEDRGFDSRGIVVYSGIHYDAVALRSFPTPSPSPSPSPSDQALRGETTTADVTTIFPSLANFGIPDNQDPILQAASQLVTLLKNAHYYTDTATFSLKCITCGTKLTGEKQARLHAQSTGHADFGEC